MKELIERIDPPILTADTRPFEHQLELKKPSVRTSEQRGYDRAIAEVVARMKRIEPDEEAAGCPASWGDFLQILESVAIEAGEHKS